jgi:hypothetical protein
VNNTTESWDKLGRTIPQTAERTRPETASFLTTTTEPNHLARLSGKYSDHCYVYWRVIEDETQDRRHNARNPEVKRFRVHDCSVDNSWLARFRFHLNM